MEGLERLEGHLFNWYDTRSLAALTPRYVLQRRQRKSLRRAHRRRRGLRELARRGSLAAPAPADAAARAESLAARAAAFGTR